MNLFEVFNITIVRIFFLKLKRKWQGNFEISAKLCDANK